MATASAIDLNTAPIPEDGVTVEIEGKGEFKALLGGSLAMAVGQAYVVLTGEVFFSHEWQITMLEASDDLTRIKVRLDPA